MEKRTPHYSLKSIQSEFCSPEKLNITATARKCAWSLGITLDGVVTIIGSLTRRNFYKSMTNDADSKVWQDVYHATHDQIVLYVKFTIDSRGYLLISFKEK